MKPAPAGTGEGRGVVAVSCTTGLPALAGAGPRPQHGPVPRPAGAVSYRPVDGPADRGWQRTWTTLVPLPHTRSTRWPCSSPRSAMRALVASKIRKPSRPSLATSRGVVRVR